MPFAMSRRPPRVPGFSYIGLHRYSLTFCARHRQPVFVDASIVDGSCTQLLESANEWGFEVLAYCFMPDHLHVLAEGRAENADLIAHAKDIKQRVAYYHPLRTGLWQKGFYDHVLRDDEATLDVAKYILENPLRAGLVREPREHPYAGSGMWTWDQLIELWQTDGRTFG